MTQQIVQALKETERTYGIRILYACESGSRAWGFESADSDYDVRFLYVRPVAGYLTVRAQRDVVEAMLPHDLDLSGWDLRKTLQLLTKSNPSLFEWLLSPIVYSEDKQFMQEFRPLAERWYSKKRIFLHYLHMAQGNWHGYLQGDSVVRKKYLYVLRPALACLWIERDLGPVPMEFDVLRQEVVSDPHVMTALDRLLAEKRAGDELAEGPPDPVLHAFLAGEMERLEHVVWPESPQPSTDELDQFLLRWASATG